MSWASHDLRETQGRQRSYKIVVWPLWSIFSMSVEVPQNDWSEYLQHCIQNHPPQFRWIVHWSIRGVVKKQSACSLMWGAYSWCQWWLVLEVCGSWRTHGQYWLCLLVSANCVFDEGLYSQLVLVETDIPHCFLPTILCNTSQVNFFFL